jgi:4-amino-4-deoxy-L-arabinose transferase and related glycosyltransferases of PMT family
MDMKQGILEDNSQSAVSNILWKILCAFLTLICSWTIWQCLVLFGEGNAKENLFCIVSFMLLLVSAFFLYKYGNKKLLWVFILCSILLNISLIFAIQTPIKSDFSVMYKAAKQVLEGKYSWTQKRYFKTWPYQIPFVFFEAAVLKIFKSVLALKIINVLCIAGTIRLIYAITERFTSARAACVAAFLYAVYPAPAMMVTVLTNQHLAALLFLAGMYVFLRFENWRWMALAGVLLALGNLARSEGTVILIALAGVAFIVLIQYIAKRKKESLLTLRNIAVVILSYLVLMQTVSGIMKLTNISEIGAKNPYPQWKFVIGLNPESVGRYTETDLWIFDIEDDAERWKRTKHAISEKFHVNSITKFITEKTKFMWASDQEYVQGLKGMDREAEIIGSWKLRDIVTYTALFEKGIYLLVLLLSLWYSLRLMRNPKSWQWYICPAIIFVNYAAYLLIEIQKRYRYFVMPFLFIAAGFGMEELVKAISPIKQRYLEKKNQNCKESIEEEKP